MADEPSKPASPSEFIRQQLEKRGWLQRDLAFVLGIQDQAINQIAVGKRGVSAEMAKALGEVFDVAPEYILGLQKAAEVSAELSRAKSPHPNISRKAKLITTYPVREMIKRRWLNADVEIEPQLAQFFGVASMDEIPHIAHAGKKTDYDEIPPAQLVWLYRARQIACERVVPAYSQGALQDALPPLQALMTAPEQVRHVPRMLSECGVRFVVVESLPGAKIDGACFWVGGGTSPVVAMSLRFDRIDNFWFVLRHELEHVLNRHGVAAAMLDVDLDGTNEAVAEEERLANTAATEFCVPKREMDSWIVRKQPYFSERDLLGFAKRLRIHPGIVAGQLRNRTKNYSIFTKYLEKVRFAIPHGFTDGWGNAEIISA